MTNNAPASRSMQWFFLILVSVWILSAMVLPLVTFCLTKSLLSLSFFGTLAPPIYILRRIIWYIFPKDDRDYKLAEAKARYAVEKHRNEKQVS